MNTNYRRQNSHSQFAAVFRWVVVVAFVSIVGLSYVELKNQMHLGGVQKHALENELSDLIQQNNALAVQIVNLKSPTALQKRLDEGFIKMIPIATQSIVHVRTADATRRVADGARSLTNFRPVSLEAGSRD